MKASGEIILILIPFLMIVGYILFTHPFGSSSSNNSPVIPCQTELDKITDLESQLQKAQAQTASPWGFIIGGLLVGVAISGIGLFWYFSQRLNTIKDAYAKKK